MSFVTISPLALQSQQCFGFPISKIALGLNHLPDPSDSLP